jgi:hypothetical protein
LYLSPPSRTNLLSQWQANKTEGEEIANETLSKSTPHLQPLPQHRPLRGGEELFLLLSPRGSHSRNGDSQSNWNESKEYRGIFGWEDDLKRDEKGRFARDDGEEYGTHVDSKGYLRISSGPHRNIRVHTLVAEALLGRKLEKWEDVDHYPDPNKLNCSFNNLRVLDHRTHGWVSSQQAQFMRRREEALKKQYEEELGADAVKEDIPFENQF